MKITSFKLLLASMTFTIGIALASAWVNNFAALAQRLDEAVVNIGADLLGKLSAASAGVAPPPSVAYERGRVEAESDICAERLKVKSLGLGSVAYPVYKVMLERDYGIEFIDYGCGITDDLMESVRGYNEVSRAVIEDRYGRGVLESVLRRAEREYLDDVSNAKAVAARRRLHPTTR